MTSLKIGLLSAAAFVFVQATPAYATPTGAQICAKMIAEGRGGGWSQSECLCTHRVVEAVFDEDIKALFFDAWYNGTNNMDAIEKLPRQSRVRKQMRTMERSLEKNCGLAR